MKTTLENSQYDTRLEASDWRFSASIVGLLKYFEYLQLEISEDYQIVDDYIEYNSEVIDKEKYLLFVEHYYSELMHHKRLEGLIQIEDLTEDQGKLLTKTLKENAVMKKVFKGLTVHDKAIIQDRIDKHRLELIQETYRNGIRLYRNFSNEGCLFSDVGKTCRLKGYYVDKGRKTKSLSYMGDYNTFIFEDHIEFDFIPFAFAHPKSPENFFINNNMDIKTLYKTAKNLRSEFMGATAEEEKVSIRELLFNYHREGANFIAYDVEVIVKRTNEDYFNTLYIRKPAIEIFKKIDKYDVLKRYIKIGNDNYISIQDKVTNSILNLVVIDDLIEMLLKETARINYYQLIWINQLIYCWLYGDSEGGFNKMSKTMSDSQRQVYGTAKSVVDVLAKRGKHNKIKSYREKMISAITMKDYDKFCDIIIQLSSNTSIAFNFSFDLFDDFEKNKNLAYTFISAFNDYNTNTYKTD